MKFLAAITGASDFERNTANLDKRTKAAARRGVDKATGVVLRSVKSHLKRRRTGLLAKSLGRKTKTYRGAVVGLVGARKGFKTTAAAAVGKKLIAYRETKKGNKLVKLKSARGVKAGAKLDPTKYQHLVEGGHKKGKGTSAAPAYPFIRPGARASQKEAEDTVKQELSAAIRG